MKSNIDDRIKTKSKLRQPNIQTSSDDLNVRSTIVHQSPGGKTGSKSILKTNGGRAVAGDGRSHTSSLSSPMKGIAEVL